ncbi:hypothetical protein I316_00025 [Kwoniella heveanensis BCC8398]|uniref:HMG box domain-containing protein n=1 Tax=Kwoniella heveanensis BCC8398 TaxID=1296120 RepID=A0A1B9H3E9_9TREE|nr:hypothetical protein I316_00025 [Kwoniella heveanensis BCC8398]
MSPSSSSLSNMSPSICPTLARDSIANYSTYIRTPPTTSSGAGVGSSGFSNAQAYDDHCHNNRARLTMTAPGSLATQHHVNSMTATAHPFHTPPPSHFMNHPHDQSHYFIASTINDPHHLSPYDATHHQAMLYSNQQQHLNFGGWTPGTTSSTITHVNPQLMEPSPSRSLSPESPTETNFSPILVQSDTTPKAHKPNPTSADDWYDGPSAWIRSVAESHRQRRATYLANPKAWPKGEGEPKVLQPLTDHCRFPHLWEVEEARKGLTEDMVVSKLMRKSEATIAKEYARCQKAGEEFKPPRPMNSAMAFADFRRPQWGDMYADMKTGAISTWLSAEWRALKDFKLEEFEWWTRVAKKYWDKYVEDYDYKFTRAPNGEGKGSKKKKAKARENAAREKAMRLSAEAARRGSARSTASRRGAKNANGAGGLAPPMSISMPDQQHQHLSATSSPNHLGLANLPHLTPTGTVQYAPTGYFDGITYSENSRTPSPPQLLTPLEAPHQHPPHSYTHPGYFYPTPSQMEYAHHHAQQQHQHITGQHQNQSQNQNQHQHQHQHQPGMTLQVSVLDNGCTNGSYYQPQSSHGPEDYYHQHSQHQHQHLHQHQHQHQNQQHHYQHSHPMHGQPPSQGGSIPTLAPYNIPSPQ